MMIMMKTARTASKRVTPATSCFLPHLLLLVLPLIRNRHQLLVLGDDNTVLVPPKEKTNANIREPSCILYIGERDDGDKTHHRRMVSVDNLSPHCKRSDIISIDIPHDGVKRTFQKSYSSSMPQTQSSWPQDPIPEMSSSSPSASLSVSSFDYWAGEDPVDGSIFNYVQNSDGTISGSMVDLTNHNVLQFHNRNGKYAVTITASSDFPPEIDPEDMGKERQLLMSKNKNENDDSGEVSETSTPRHLNIVSPSKDSMIPSFVHVNIQPNRKDQGSSASRSRKLYDDDGGNLDIMVVWTAAAECKAYGQDTGCTLTAQSESNMLALVNLAVIETNIAFQTSGIDTELLLVHAYRHPLYVESSFSSTLRDLSSGWLPDVVSNRATYGADIVAMLIDDSQYCGLAKIGPRIDLMYSVTAWNCATGYYTFGHEVGHNLGCLHDRGTKDECSSGGYNYGYRDPSANFRTVLAYDCVSGQCDNNAGGGCSRIPRFSNPNFTFNNTALGTSTIDNARAINDVRVEVAGYYEHVSSQSKAPTPMVPTPAPTPRCDANELDVLVSVASDQYPFEITWMIQNDSGAIVKSDDGKIVDIFTQYTENVCLDSSGCYTFTVNDSYGDGIATPFSLTVDGDVKLSNPGVNFASLNVRFGECAPTASPSTVPTIAPTPGPTSIPCTANELDVLVSVTSDRYPAEITWMIQNDSGEIVKSDDGEIVDIFTQYIENVCLDSSGCYTFTINDSYSDGIATPFSLTVDGDVKLSNPGVNFASLNVRFGECAPTASPSAVPTIAPTPGPTRTPSIPCTANELDVLVSVTSDRYPAETTWTIQNDSGAIVKSDDGKIVDIFTQYIENVCLDSSGCYTFTINDSYGDGITTPFSLTVDGDVKLSNPDIAFASLSEEFGQCATLPPSQAPTKATTIAPTKAPTPVLSCSCKDTILRFKVTWNGRLITRDCTWIGNKATVQRCNIEGVKEACPDTCGLC